MISKEKYNDKVKPLCFVISRITIILLVILNNLERGVKCNYWSLNSVKQVQIVIPFDKTETVMDFLHDVLDVKNVMKFNADNAHLLQFRISDDKMLDTVEGLKSRGVGVEFGFVDMLDLKASLPRYASEESTEKRMQREATLAVEEIYDNVKKQASLSFDFIAFVMISALVAGFGLIQNNATIIVASMLLSPLIGPMLGVALGWVVRDWDLSMKGTVNELIALGLSFAVGAVMALLMPILAPPDSLYPGYPGFLAQVVDDYTNNVATEVTRRGGFSALDVGIAVFSGAAVAISITKGDMSSLVGVAISAALMPPAVNVGMMIMLGLVSGEMIAMNIGVGSLMLLGMNIILIDIAAIVMFRIKKLTVIADKSATWTAVTRFRQARTTELYHVGVAEPDEEKEVITFTPAKEKREQKSKSSKVSDDPAAKNES